MKTCKKRKTHIRRGLETVEAAILLPIILMVTFGALKYGWIFLKYQQIANAARQAARIAIRPAPNSTTLAIAEIDQLMTDAKITGVSREITYGPDAFPFGKPAGDRVSVHVEVDTALVDILPTPSWIPTPATLGTTVTMCKEG